MTAQPVRVSADRRRAEEWSVVLSAARIPHRIEPAGSEWLVIVAERDLPRAAAWLESYDREQQSVRAPGPPIVEYGATWTGVLAVLCLIAFHIIVRSATPFAWFESGAASARWIRAGEWWRTVTALTLHADAVHLMSNAAAGALFFTLAFRLFGPGVGAGLVLLAGAAGNAVNALVRPAAHTAVGASTAVFGAIGALAGWQFLRRYSAPAERRRAWLSLAAGLALLAWLGASPHTDVMAHLFGFLAGLALGGSAAALFERPPGRPAQRLLLAISGVAVASSWILALS